MDSGLKTEKDDEGYLDSSKSASAMKDNNTQTETHFEKTPAAHVKCETEPPGPELSGISTSSLFGSTSEKNERWMREGRGKREHTTHIDPGGLQWGSISLVRSIQISSKTEEYSVPVKRQKTSHSSDAYDTGDSGIHKSMSQDGSHSKRQDKDESSAEGSSMEMETLQSCSTKVAPLKMWAFSEEDIKCRLKECQSVLQEVSRTLSKIPVHSIQTKWK
ncbi:uncharacterized protein LOC102361671 [Latimeria chalumnae]|uniref:uncharacterized protein LOC102361671 n=1 Tax=Latimeria chalumnae TaxID=7897 RepID=UPI00313CBA79